MTEDRGTALYIWVSDRTDCTLASFERNDLGRYRLEISCPIGWTLRPDEGQGVVLGNVFGETLSPMDVYRRAVRGDGFYVRGASPPAPVFDGDFCHAEDDGVCRWTACPQHRDQEPMRTGRTCPLVAD